jgi:exopolysaccharide production protein ExoQ
MSPNTATAACGLFIVAVLLLNRDRQSPGSWSLWIPVAWLLICGSRNVSQWIGGVGADPSADRAFVDGNPLDAAIFAGLMAAGFLVLLARRGRLGPVLRGNGPLLVFFLYCLVSVLWSDYSLVAFKRWTKAVGDVVMVLVVVTDPDPVAATKRLLMRTGVLLIPISILLIRYYPALGRSYSAWTGTAYNTGVATGKNGLGYVCLIFGLGSLWCLLDEFRGGERVRAAGPLIAQGALLALALWLFQMAHSATSFSSFLIGGVLMAVTRLRALARRSAAMHLLVGTVLFVVLYATLLNPEAGLVEAVGRDSTLTGRTRIWNTALSLTVNPLFGAGYESFWLGDRLEKIWSSEPDHPNQAHNGYLEVFLDLGWVGLVLLGLVEAWGYRTVIRALRWNPRTGGLRLAFFVVAAIYNLTEHAFRELHPVWIAFLLAIIVVPDGSRQEDSSSQSDSRKPGASYGRSPRISRTTAPLRRSWEDG